MLRAACLRLQAPVLVPSCSWTILNSDCSIARLWQVTIGSVFKRQGLGKWEGDKVHCCSYTASRCCFHVGSRAFTVTLTPEPQCASGATGVPGATIAAVETSAKRSSRKRNKEIFDQFDLKNWTWPLFCAHHAWRDRTNAWVTQKREERSRSYQDINPNYYVTISIYWLRSRLLDSTKSWDLRCNKNHAASWFSPPFKATAQSFASKELSMSRQRIKKRC